MKKWLVLISLGVLVGSGLLTAKAVYAACDASLCETNPLHTKLWVDFYGTLDTPGDACRKLQETGAPPPDSLHTVCCEDGVFTSLSLPGVPTFTNISWAKWCTPPGVKVVLEDECTCDDQTCPEGYKVEIWYTHHQKCVKCDCKLVTKPVPAFDPCWDKDKWNPDTLSYGDTIEKCVRCLGGPEHEMVDYRPKSADFSWTALGCPPTDPAEFVAWILARAVGIGGGIAFLLMLWGGFKIITSAGDPQKLNEGKDILVSAAAGLLFIIFSLFLLRIVGVDILGLPGFNP